MAIDDRIRKLHEQCLYPVARVRTDRVGGSGTVIFSAKDSNGKWDTVLLTNHHVVEDNIKVKEQWDPVLGKQVKKEIRSTVSIEFFVYNHFSKAVGVIGKEGDIVAYDAPQDIALLRVRDQENGYQYIARLIPRDQIDNIHLFERTYAVGASLGHAPIVTEGHINHLDDEIDNYRYGLSSSNIIFGVSGGAIFRPNDQDNFELIGIPSRIAVTITGFSASPISHMGWFVTPDRIYNILDEQFFQYVYDPSYTREKCDSLRKKKQDDDRRLAELKLGVVEDKEVEEKEK